MRARFLLQVIMRDRATKHFCDELVAKTDAKRGYLSLDKVLNRESAHDLRPLAPPCASRRPRPSRHARRNRRDKGERGALMRETLGGLPIGILARLHDENFFHGASKNMLPLAPKCQGQRFPTTTGQPVTWLGSL